MTEGRAVSLHHTREFDLPAGDGGSYRILLAVPDEPPPPDGFPTLYLLDGGAFFGTLVEMVRLRRNRPAMTGVEASIVVGIAHPGVHPYDRARRKADFTPEPEGAAGAFRAFLHDVLQPGIESDLPADPRRRVLLGHSLAGAFVLDSWVEAPERYDAVLAVSPSIWAFRKRLFDAVERSSEQRNTPSGGRVMVAVGEYDQALAPWQSDGPDPGKLRERRDARRMVDDARLWCAQLATAAPDTEVDFEVLADEDHASVVPVALARSLRQLVGIR